MSELLANLTTFIGGVGGVVIGYFLIALLLVAAFAPLFYWVRKSSSSRRRRHSGLERFDASLNHADEGYDDRIPDRS